MITRSVHRTAAKLAWGPLVVGFGLATPAWAQKLGQAPGTDIPWLRYFGALTLCLFLAVGAAVVLKARQSGIPSSFLRNWRGRGSWLASLSGAQVKRFRLLETLRLSPQAELCLVRCDDEDFALAVTPQGVSVLPLIKRGGSASVEP